MKQGNHIVIQNSKVIKVDVAVLLLKEGDYFVAYCPALETSGYGLTEEEAKASFDENVEIFIEESKRKGTLEKLLLSYGWSLRKMPKPSYDPPQMSIKKINMSRHVVSQRVALPY